MGSLPLRVADEEDVALSAINSFVQGARAGKFPRLDDESNLWRLLVTITARKATAQRRRHFAARRSGGKVRGESAFVPSDGDSAEGGIGTVPGEIPTPAFAVQVAEEYRLLFEKLDDPLLRDIVRWKMEAYSNQEIAQKLGRTERHDRTQAVAHPRIMVGGHLSMPRRNLPASCRTSSSANRQIDAVCDRFELAWDAGERPRIEDYLELFPAADRRELLKELLASELALRAGQHEEGDRHEYARRFSAYHEIVAQVFDRRTASTPATAEAGERLLEVIKAFRSGRRRIAPTTAIQGADRDLPALAGLLSRHAESDPAQVDVPLDARLWLWIMRICRKRQVFDPAAVEVLVCDLLASFPPLRQAILIDVLLGHPFSQAARANDATERTVTSTILAAISLLEEAG